MDLDEIQAHLDRLFAGRTARPSREQTAGLREALLQFKVAMGQLRDDVARTERELELARKELGDYERRGRMAAEIGDAETAQIADSFTAKARERVDLLERKVIVLRDELAIAEREYATTMERFQASSRGVPFEPGASSQGGEVGTGPAEPTSPQLDRQAKEAAVEAQLAHLKKKLGRE